MTLVQGTEYKEAAGYVKSSRTMYTMMDFAKSHLLMFCGHNAKSKHTVVCHPGWYIPIRASLYVYFITLMNLKTLSLVLV